MWIYLIMHISIFKFCNDFTKCILILFISLTKTSLSSSLLPKLVPILFICLFLHLESNLCHPYALSCVDFRWTMVSLPVCKSLRKTDYPFPLSCQLSIASYLRLGVHVYLQYPCWDIYYLRFWGLEYAVTTAMSLCLYLPYTENTHFFVVTYPLCQLKSLCPPMFCNGTWALEYGVYISFRTEHSTV